MYEKRYHDSIGMSDLYKMPFVLHQLKGDIPNFLVISSISKGFPNFSLSYSMDTDISTLEAPTFTTLSHGPGSNNVLQTLKWDHPPTLIGTKESEKNQFHLKIIIFVKIEEFS